MSNLNHGYFPIPDEEKTDHYATHASPPTSDCLNEVCEIGVEKRSKWQKRPLSLWPWALHLLFFTGSLCTGLLVSRSSIPEGCLPDKSDILLGERRKPIKTRFDGSFDGYSPFKGPPNPEVDKAWDDILKLRIMAIPESAFQTLSVSKHSVKVPSELGIGGRLAIFDTIHLLHCVRSLWKLAYPDYYLRNMTDFWSDSTREDWFSHINHCADMLRQKLMCDASSAVVTYNWLENHYHPHPNFNVEHKCRNYDELLIAAKKYEIPDGALPVKGFFRPIDRPFVEFVDPPYDPYEEGKVLHPVQTP